LGVLGPIETLFLVAPLPVVPLALRLVARTGDPSGKALSAARRLQPWAALAVVGSFLTRRGPAAAALAAPWLLFTLLLLTLSSVSLLLGMACALAYAVGEFTGIGLISLGQMAHIHGPLNALGFVLTGLLGWTLVPRNLRPETL